MSKIQVNEIVNHSDDGAPDCPFGLQISGVVTATSMSISGNVSIGGTLTYDDVTNVDSVGIITAQAGINISGGNLNVGTSATITAGGAVSAVSFTGDGSGLSNINSVPTGVIFLWSGAVNAIPSGYVLCDGNNGTPDLRDRFIVGAGNNYAVGASGGSADSVIISHSHNITGTAQSGGEHVHDIDDPGHTHTYQRSASTVEYGDRNNSARALSYQTRNTSSQVTGITVVSTGSSHTHSLVGIASTAGVAGTNLNLPPYYALCYIQKT